MPVHGRIPGNSNTVKTHATNAHMFNIGISPYFIATCNTNMQYYTNMY